MADYAGISAVSETLQSLLKEHITDNSDAELGSVSIDLRSPKEMRDANGAVGVSLWLYEIVRNEHVLNRPPQRTEDRLEPQPLPVNLRYLITPITDEPTDEQTLMGRVLQTFNDHSILEGSALRDGSTTELRLSLETPTLEELTRIWDALKEPYQLSVMYLVQVVEIETDHEPDSVAPVVVRESHYAQIIDVD